MTAVPKAANTRAPLASRKVGRDRWGSRPTVRGGASLLLADWQAGCKPPATLSWPTCCRREGGERGPNVGRQASRLPASSQALDEQAGLLAWAGSRTMNTRRTAVTTDYGYYGHGSLLKPCANLLFMDPFSTHCICLDSTRLTTIPWCGMAGRHRCTSIRASSIRAFLPCTLGLASSASPPRRLDDGGIDARTHMLINLHLQSAHEGRLPRSSGFAWWMVGELQILKAIGGKQQGQVSSCWRV